MWRWAIHCQRRAHILLRQVLPLAGRYLDRARQGDYFACMPALPLVSLVCRDTVAGSRGLPWLICLKVLQVLCPHACSGLIKHPPCSEASCSEETARAMGCIPELRLLSKGSLAPCTFVSLWLLAMNTQASACRQACNRPAQSRAVTIRRTTVCKTWALKTLLDPVSAR